MQIGRAKLVCSLATSSVTKCTACREPVYVDIIARSNLQRGCQSGAAASGRLFCHQVCHLLLQNGRKGWQRFKPRPRDSSSSGSGRCGGGPQALGCHAVQQVCSLVMSLHLSLSSLRLDTESAQEHVDDPEVGRWRPIMSHAVHSRLCLHHDLAVRQLATAE